MNHPYRSPPLPDTREASKRSWASRFATRLRRRLALAVRGRWRERFVRERCDACGWTHVSERRSGMYYQPGELTFHVMRCHMRGSK